MTDQNVASAASFAGNANRQDKPSNQAIRDAARKSAAAAPPLTEQQRAALRALLAR